MLTPITPRIVIVAYVDCLIDVINDTVFNELIDWLMYCHVAGRNPRIFTPLINHAQLNVCT